MALHVTAEGGLTSEGMLLATLRTARGIFPCVL